MKKKFKIGNFVAEVNSPVPFGNSEPFSLFAYNGSQTDFTVTVEFSSSLPPKIENPQYEAHDRVCNYENGTFYCYYKSHDNKDAYYAKRTVDGNDITLVINEEYKDMIRADVIFSLVGIEEIVAMCNGCVLHSSFIEKDGGAILFTGPCDIGKSTQANLWRNHADAVIINGDKTFIFEKDGVFYASGSPFSGSSKDCLNKVLPLKAIIGLEQAEQNFAKRLVSAEAFYKLYKNCYPVPHSRDLTAALIDFVEKLSQNVPVFDYSCLADESAVRYLESKLCPIMQSL
ncbi:MAG: hypothetical protein J6R20_00445, partial [Clostridia bacterium]|nr:hypothetical protein [Clostridia bacterium]